MKKILSVLFWITLFHQGLQGQDYPFVKHTTDETRTLGMLDQTMASSGNVTYFASHDGIVVSEYIDGQWERAGIIPTPDPTKDGFGITLFLKGNYLFVGSTVFDDNLGTGENKVYVYSVNGTSYSLQQTLIPPSGSSLSGFGVSIYSDGSRLVVGASSNSASYTKEAVVIYQLNNNAWNYEDIIYEPEVGFGEHNFFGYFDIAVAGDIILISYDLLPNGYSPGYTSQLLIYKKKTGSWQNVQTIQSSGLIGHTIRIHGDMCLVGDRWKKKIDQYHLDPVNDASTLTFVQSISKDEPYFGYTFDFNGKLLVVSSYSTSGPISDVFVYEYSNGNWIFKRSFRRYYVSIASIVVREDFLLTEEHNTSSNSHVGDLYIYGLWAKPTFTCFNTSTQLSIRTQISDGAITSPEDIEFDDSSPEVEVRWYNDLTSTTPIAYGNPFTTGQLTESRSYYVEADLYELSSPVRQRVEVCVGPNDQDLAISIIPTKEAYQIDEQVHFYVAPTSDGTFDYGNGDTGTSSYYKYSEAGTYTVTFTKQHHECGHCSQSVSTTIRVVEPLCEFYLPANSNGQFQMDKLTGNIVYQRDDCPAEIPLDCWQGPIEPIPNAVTASAAAFTDKWNYQVVHNDKYNTNLSEANTYETGTRGKWRLQSSYTFNTTDINRDKNYNTGTYQLTTFNWKYPQVSESRSWVKTTTVEHYSPNGDALQERNALGIASVAKFGYNDAVPFLTAQNADYGSVRYESFEMLYNGSLEEGDPIGALEITSNNGHAGHKSLKLRSNDKFLFEKMSVPATNTLLTSKMWVKGTVTTNKLKLKVETEDGVTLIASASFQKISSSGVWSLYQAQLSLGSYKQFQVSIGNEGSTTVWIDDLRVQPADSQMSAYVYDPQNLRLLAIFDDQHYGLFYHYNAEGKLVRKQLETERGSQTLQETFYNLPSQE